MDSKILVLSMDRSTKKLKPKRLRVPHACDRCRAKKKKCDGRRPCKLCKNSLKECIYSDRKKASASAEEPVPLPPIDIAMKLMQKSWNRAGVLFSFYHKPTIVRMLETLYLPLEHLTEEQMRARPLIYAILAVGALFSKDDWQESDNKLKEFYQDEGKRYFLAAKSMLDLTNITDLFAIQTMCMLTMFLQCSAELKSCYSYMGITLRAALSEGLHIKKSLNGPSAIEDESRKRLFWTVYKVDIYMNCILGLPQSIPEDSVNQDFPSEFDDENITCEGFLEQAAGKISCATINNEHTKLMLIILRIQKTLYPVVTWTEETYTKMLALTNDLDEWLLRLPIQLNPECNCNNDSEQADRLRPSKLLYMDFLLARLLLSLPFVHYIALEPIEAPHYAFQISVGWSCIQVAHDVIYLAEEMIENKLLFSGHWFSMHTIFQSVKCLMFYQRLMDSSLAETNGMNVREVCKLGVQVLTCLKNGSQAGERTFDALTFLFKDFIRNTVNLSLHVKANAAARSQLGTEEEDLQWWIDRTKLEEIGG